MNNTFTPKNYKKVLKIISNFHNVTSIFIYFSLLFIIDYSGIMNLYGENIVRRCMHMLKRRDELSYQSRLKPYSVPLPQFLEKEYIDELNSINVENKIDLPWLSRVNTGTHMYDKMDEAEKKIFDICSEKIRVKVSDILGEELYHLPNNSNLFYTYHGNHSFHLWHVDPENIDSLYNVILCVERKGDISPFQYKDDNQQIYTIDTQPGDGIFFRGGTTIHQIPPNNDPNSKRKVIALSFTTDKKYATKKSLCTYLEGGSNYFNIIKWILFVFLINYICGFFSNINRVDYKIIFTLLIICLFVTKYVPLYYDIGFGTGRPTSFTYNGIILMSSIIWSLSIKRGILFFIYFALSEVFFPREWVYYD